jgi:hypothetical protein
MSDTYHIVQRQVFDISFPEEEKAYELQTRFSHLFYNDAAPIMTAVFHRLIPGDLLLQLDQLVLDLGRMKYDRLAKDFPERFREALEKELALALDEYVRHEIPGRNKSLTDVLEHFLTTGTLPWWAAGELLVNPAGVIDRLARNDPSGLKDLLMNIGQHDYVRRRLVFQFHTATIRRIVETLEPDEAAFIFVYYADVVQIQSVERFFRQEMSEFEKHFWIFIFTYLLVDRGSNFNRKIFVKSTLARMARQHNLAYGTLITLFFRALESTSAILVRHSTLSDIIATLYYEEEQQMEQDLPHHSSGVLMEKMEVIRYYLIHGHLTGLPVLYSTSALSEVLTRLMEEAPDKVYDIIRSMSGQTGLWARIVRAFDEATLQRLVRLREPDESAFIFHYAKRLETLQRQKLLVKTDSAGFHHSLWELILAFLWTERGNVFNSRVFLEYNIRMIARRHQLSYRQLLAFLVQGIGQDIRSDRDSSLFHSLALLLKECAEPSAHAPALSNQPSPVIPPPPVAQPVMPPPPPAVHPPAGPPVIYIHNAGLVLLHPLLPHFFSRLGLTEKARFIDLAAQHRAAHLLQYLVDGSGDHPEQLLTLNKILCDLPMEDTLPLAFTVTETERVLADELIEVLRRQWEKLKNTSPEGLRQSFLQRKGSLTSSRDGWRLQVEQKGFDMLLQHLPWSWSLIRLPWMHKILYTEWI